MRGVLETFRASERSNDFHNLTKMFFAFSLLSHEWLEEDSRICVMWVSAQTERRRRHE